MMHDDKLELIQAISKVLIAIIMIYGVAIGVVQIISTFIPYAGPAALLVGLCVLFGQVR